MIKLLFVLPLVLLSSCASKPAPVPTPPPEKIETVDNEPAEGPKCEVPSEIYFAHIHRCADSIQEQRPEFQRSFVEAYCACFFYNAIFRYACEELESIPHEKLVEIANQCIDNLIQD